MEGTRASLMSLNVTQEIIRQIPQTDAGSIPIQANIFLFGAAHAVLDTTKNMFNLATNLGF